jgi:hypothetical protein
MLTKLDIITARSDTLSLTLADFSSGYEVRSIDGLDPVNANIVSSQMAQVDGAQSQSSRRDTRNITMTLGLKPDYLQHSVASLRSKLYKYLMPKSVVTLNFYVDGSLYAVTTGTVESLGAPIFSADPVANISIICYDPDFYAPTVTSVDGETVDDTSTQTITYEGTSDAGTVFTLSPERDMTGFTIYNTHPDNTQQKFDFEGQIFNGDIVVISSIPLKKSATIIRDTQASSKLYFVQAPSDWITLSEGDNDIRVYSDDEAVPYTLDYTLKYGGL